MRDALGSLGEAAQEQCGGRAVAADKLHVTLFFLGNVERQLLLELKALGSEIRAGAFELELDTLDFWRHNHIVWAGTTRCPETLAALAASLRTALLTLGFGEEPRAYVPHVTLVRDAQRAPKNVPVTPTRWTVREFVLVESVQVGGAAGYDVVARWPLLV